MNSRYYIASAFLALCVLLILSLSFITSSPPSAVDTPSNSITSAPKNNDSESISRFSSTPMIRGEISGSQLNRSQIELALEEIDTRLKIDQTEEALNELDALLERFDSMSVTEKRDLLTAYATYFLRNSQNDDARFFYEQILLLPDLDYTNRLAVLQMLARIAMASEDWDGFLAYNDQYFDEGGGYNWVVTGHLVRAYQMRENYNAAGDSMMLHLETGIHPEYDGSAEQYQRRYAGYESIPLHMTNGSEAIILAQKMLNQFDQPGNWKVLSELYQSQGDSQNFNITIESAREKGFIDSSGNWLN